MYKDPYSESRLNLALCGKWAQYYGLSAVPNRRIPIDAVPLFPPQNLVKVHQPEEQRHQQVHDLAADRARCLGRVRAGAALGDLLDAVAAQAFVGGER